MKKIIYILGSIIIFLMSMIHTNESSMKDLPIYQGEPFVILNNNLVEMNKDDYELRSFIQFKPLDLLGRTQEVIACLSIETMPDENEERGPIGMIKPSGWQTKRYDDLIADKYLYNRCHLIAYSLSSLNDEKRNLITGTRSFNIDGMLPFENRVAHYIRKTHHHVLYKATPIYQGNELVARGIQLQALSLEDDQIHFNVFIFNVQDGIEINYQDGTSQRKSYQQDVSKEHVLNISSMKIHKKNCEALLHMSDHNKRYSNTSLELLLDVGYTKCQICYK